MKIKKKVIRLTESDLHRIIAKSVKNVLNEDRESALNAYGRNPNNSDRDALMNYRKQREPFLSR